MNVLHRYILRRLLAAFAVAFPALIISIWLTQAIGDLDLVTSRGQGIGVFAQASALLLPSLFLLVAPITMLIVVATTLNWLNADSELISVEAAGARRTLLLRSVLVIALPMTLIAAACSLYLSPSAARADASLVEEVNTNVIATLVRPGQFQSLGDGVVIQAAAVHQDGTLEGLFVFDRRPGNETIAYIAEAGAMIENERGQFLLMQDGVIQRRNLTSAAVSTIQFESYAFDLTTLASQSVAGDLQPGQRPLSYLLSPSPSDPIFQANPHRYTAEFHNRVAKPLYVLALSLVPLALMGGARTTRQGGGKRMALTALIGIGLLVAGMSLESAATGNPAFVPLTYGIPLGGILLSLAAILRRGRGSFRRGAPRPMTTGSV